MVQCSSARPWRTGGGGVGDPRLAVNIGGLALKSPVMPASGCFGLEMAALIDLNALGALVPKTIFYHSRSGNPAPRLAETPSGMLNSIGIPSLGVEHFVTDLLPRYRQYRPPIIVSIGGLAVHEYWDLAERLDGVPGVAGLEINISCPNLEAGGLEIGADPHTVEAVVRGVADRFHGPLIAKLTPNVTSIAEIARAAEVGGATALSAINTFSGMVIDVESRRTATGTMTGGLSGPAIRPLAVRMVWQVARAVRIPVIGMGGITNTRDALEFFLAGATAIAVGTANFTRPTTMIEIIRGLSQHLDDQRFDSVTALIGRLEVGALVVTEPRAKAS
ncbi:MAG: dihydroorotate dehydrogenase [Chloroflexi bacterium]|nr:dihydroorotate dehydrogenase [Chloroflexota bacterium]